MKDWSQNYRAHINKFAEKYPNSVAIACLYDDGTETNLTFANLLNKIIDFKLVLDRLGLKAGDRIVLIDNHMPSAFQTIVSAAYWNVTIVPLDPKVPEMELNRYIDLVDPRAVFIEYALLSKLTEEIRKKYPILDISDEKHAYPDISGFEEHESLAPTIDPDRDTVAIIMSSGTTGSTKPVMITYKSLLHGAKACRRVYKLNHKTRFFIVFPFSHISGLAASHCVFLNGGGLQMVYPFTTASLQPALMHFQPTMFGMVPKVFDIILHAMEQKIEGMGAAVMWYYRSARKISAWFQIHFGNRRVGKLLLKPFSKALFGKNIELLFIGTAPGVKETEEAFMDMGVVWAQVYASTECSVPITGTDYYDRYKPGTVGNVHHNSGIEVKINKPDAEGIGEIYVKTKQIMKGYFREPELTKAAFDQGYFRTGDLGYIDYEGYLHITGRVKESIMLHTGKKVAPTDLERILAPACDEDNLVTVVGVTVKEKGYDEIHAFFESRDYSEEKKEKLKNRLLEYAKKNASLYPIKEVHFLDQIPKTSVFKVKRYLLKEYVLNNSSKIQEGKSDAAGESAAETSVMTDELPEETQLDQIVEIIRNCSKLNTEIQESSRLSEDLGLDSLIIFEISSEIEEKFGVSINESLSNLSTVGAIAAYVAEGKKAGNTKKGKAKGIDGEYPKKRTAFHRMTLSIMKAMSRRLWDLRTEGLENIPKSGAYILCPNHQSNLDGLWVLASMGNHSPETDKLACMAKQELLVKKGFGFLMTMMGNIPVDRTGNTAPAMHYSREWLKKGGCMIIHPEGTRTRDGVMLPFKAGAAQLAIDAGVPIVPVAIDGAYEIYAPGKAIPALRGKDGKKPVLHITFGKPVYPGEKSAEEMMSLVRDVVAANLNAG